LPVGRVNAVTGLRGSGQLIVDDIVERLDLLVDGDRGVGIITVTSKDMMMGRCVDGGEEWIGREILFIYWQEDQP
jgi:hypothetical protein